ncbi:Dna2-domain-containing protein [Macrolepiota fuliginosa MF-IS2]|uniref:DNA replication ATP-dependent helicase/nuclease DNA2 n=1 Tax=Macrolepiota fuliginosa MF-IS2 TaxID=1400762 RepID=A0A9P5XCH1_9AGAR|nr:Dna2-domain-containing protein [Macrolepiota fuliginosa MF-IS2]
MPPARVSQQDEADFMQSLLSGLDNTLSSNPPTTPSKSKKPKKVERVLERVKTPNKTPKKLKDEHALPTTSTTSAPMSQEDDDMAALLEGAEDWDWSDMNDFITPKKSKPLPRVVAREYQKEACTRGFVESVSQVQIKGRSQKVLVVKVDPGEERRSVTLEDDWIVTDVRIGDVINVIGSFQTLASTSSTSSLTSTIHITSKSNFLILHPDILITATALSNASQCRRKPLLSGLVRSTSDITPALVWGNILHEVMQLCLSENCWEEKWIEERIDGAVRKNLVNIVKIEMTVEEALTEVKARAKGLIAFAKKYLGAKPRPEGVLTDTRSDSGDAQSLLAITDLLDVEEDIWSPTYGLKGKIDATVHSVIAQPKAPANQINHYFPKSSKLNPRESEILSGAVPFEIKTGRSIAGMEHRAQTMLYTLLVAERYHQEVDAGLLYYTQKEEVVRVPVVRNELRGLIMARNELAGYMMRRHRVGEGRVGQNEDEPFLPPTIDDERACKKCYVLDTCMLYRKAVENVTDTSSPIADAYELKTSHLTQLQLEFFKKWERLISLEEKDIHRFKKELWTMGAKEREEKGRCFAAMVLDTSYDPTPSAGSQSGQYREDKIHKFTYRFLRSSETRTSTRKTQDGKEEEYESLLSGHMAVGEAITVSIEPDLLALARGFIVDLTPRTVVLGVDHELDLERIRWRLTTGCQKPDQLRPGEEVIFRIDKDDLFGGMARIRDNLAQMFYAQGDMKRLRLVVDLRAPMFENLDWIDDEYCRDWREFVKHTKQLNSNQKEAVKRVLSARDYALVLGMPGTGKTSVIASLVKVLVGMGKSVLLSAYTHSAVDNVLLRLKSETKTEGELGFGILRLGNLDKIHPDVQEFTLAKRKQAVTVEQLEAQLMSPPVVATTCLSVDQFVRSIQARRGGLDVSLFRRLSDAHPEAVVELAEQYRMNEEIMTLSNRLIYGERLRCGSESVRKRKLSIPRWDVVKKLCERAGCVCSTAASRGQGVGGCWLRQLLDERCKAVFVDTDGIPAHESRAGDLIQNEVEAELVRQVTEALILGGVSPEQVGIITLYRQQVKLISHLLGGRRDVEILTADRSQGRDKDIIIFSMVRSNDEGRTGDLVKDWRRMNVSFTRARSKLIIFGSRQTLQATPLLKEFFELMDEKGWVLSMPNEAHMAHDSVLRATDITPSKRSGEERENVIEEDKDVRPMKKMRRGHDGVDSGILKGKPMLQDVINDIL